MKAKRTKMSMAERQLQDLTLKEGMRLSVVANALYGHANRGSLGAASRLMKKTGWTTYKVGLDVYIRPIEDTVDDVTPSDLLGLVRSVVENHKAQTELIERLQGSIERMMDDLEAMRNTLNTINLQRPTVRPKVERALAVYGE